MLLRILSTECYGSLHLHFLPQRLTGQPFLGKNSPDAAFAAMQGRNRSFYLLASRRRPYHSFPDSFLRLFLRIGHLQYHLLGVLGVPSSAEIHDGGFHDDAKKRLIYKDYCCFREVGTQQLFLNFRDAKCI